jgi:hypothetical protein
MVDIDIDAVVVLGPEGHPMRPVEQRERKRFRISDRRQRKQKARSFSKKGPAMGLEPTWVWARDWTWSSKKRKARAIKLRL